jgi:hypothetical protein
MRTRATARERLEFRSTLTDTVMDQVEEELGSLLADLPKDTPSEVFETIRNEVLPHSRSVCEALSLTELQDESALRSHIAGALSTAKYLVHCHLADRRRNGE